MIDPQSTLAAAAVMAGGVLLTLALVALALLAADAWEQHHRNQTREGLDREGQP